MEELMPKPPRGPPMALILPLHGPPIIQMSLDIGCSMSSQINLPGPEQEIIALAFQTEQRLVR